MSSTTYTLNWNTLKKGSLIRFTNDGSGTVYRVLTLASDGTAQLMPHRNFALYNQVSYSGTDTDVYYMMSNAAQTKRYYIYTKKLSELSGMSSYESKLRNLPFYSYLQDEAVNQTIWMINDTPRSSAGGVYFRDPEGRGEISSTRFYKTSLQINNPTLYKWRPLALDDLVDYLGSEPTLDEFVKFWPNISYGMNKLSSQYMSLYDTGGGYNEYRSGYIFADNASPGYDTLDTYSFLKSESTSPRFIPVFKVNLRTLLSNQITFKTVQE